MDLQMKLVVVVNLIFFSTFNQVENSGPSSKICLDRRAKSLVCSKTHHVVGSWGSLSVLRTVKYVFTLVHTDDYAHMKLFLLYKRNRSFFYIYDCLQPGDVMCIVVSLQYNTQSHEHECLAQTGLKWGTQLAQC